MSKFKKSLLLRDNQKSLLLRDWEKVYQNKTIKKLLKQHTEGHAWTAVSLAFAKGWEMGFAFGLGATKEEQIKWEKEVAKK